MAVRGRKPKPTALKKLEGNPGKRPLNHKEPKPKKGLPICPDWIESEAKIEWKRMCGILGPMGLLTEMDMTAFAGYCQAYARWKAAEEYLTANGETFETPSGYIQQVPQVSIAQTNMKIMLKFCTEFGLTPSARSRISIGNEGEPKDEMEKILEGENE